MIHGVRRADFEKSEAIAKRLFRKVLLRDESMPLEKISWWHGLHSVGHRRVHLGKHLPKLGGSERVLERPVRILDEKLIKLRV